MSRRLSVFWLLAHLALLLAILWAGVLGFSIAASVDILRSEKDYRKATFRVETLHYDSGDTDLEGCGPIYWAEGWVLPDNRLERLSLLEYFPTPPRNREDMEKALHKGDVLQVLLNPDKTDMIVQGGTPRLLLDGPNVWTQRRAALKSMLAWATLPLLITSALVYFARRWAHSGPLITWSTRDDRDEDPATQGQGAAITSSCGPGV